MKIGGSVALVTGANRGLGRVFARELVSRGAAKVYGAARDPAGVSEAGVTPIALDVTDAERVAQVAAQCADISLLVNNAGVLRYSTFINAPSVDAARAEMEVNYFGTLSMCRAFAPVLAANGGGAIVNMLSVTSFYTNLIDASYGASKAAEWSLTNGVRMNCTVRAPWWSPCTPASSTPTWPRSPPMCPRTAPSRLPGRPSTPSRPARPRCSPTSGPDRQGTAVTRSGPDLPAPPGILGRRAQGRQLAGHSAPKQSVDVTTYREE